MADRLDRPRWAAAALWIVVLAATVFVARQGLRVHGMVFYDEKYAVEGARFLSDHFEDVFSARGYAGRGLERLTSLMLLPVVWLFPDTADQFVAGRWIWALSWALLALPVYALARGLGLPRRWGVAAGALAVFTPWAVFGTIFINTAPGTTTAVAALWAIWRATLAPSMRADALALGLIVLATLARVSHLAVAIAWPVAIAVEAWRGALPGATATAKLRELPRHAYRSHPLLVWGAAVGVAVLLARGANAFVGGYPTRLDFPVEALWRRVELFVAHGATGMTFVAFIVGVAWLVRSVAEPWDRAVRTFGVIGVTATVALLYVNHVGGYDERYEMPALALLFVAFAAALARREVGLAGTAVAAVFTWYCVQRFGFVGHRESFDYVNAPGRQWFSTGWIRSLGDSTGAGKDVLVALVMGGACAIALGLSATRWRRHGALVAVVLFGTLWSGLAGARFVALRLPTGYRGDAEFSDMTFVDRVTGGERADPVIGPPVRSQLVRNTWLELQFFNRSVHHPLSLGGPSYFLCCLKFGYALVADVDWSSGAVTPRGGTLPRYALTTPDWVPGGLAGRLLEVSIAPIRPVRVYRLDSPVRAAWAARGMTAEGWLIPGRRGTLRAFAAGAPTTGAPCLRVTVLAPRRSSAAWMLGRMSGRVEASRRRRVDVPLPGLRDRGHADVAVRGPQGARFGLHGVEVVRCGAPDPVAPRREAPA